MKLAGVIEAITSIGVFIAIGLFILIAEFIYSLFE